MDAELQIGFDPTAWHLPAEDYDTVAAGLGHPGAPMRIGVVAPLAGTLLLNPRAAGKVALTVTVQPVGWNPSGADWPEPLLYVSSATGPAQASPGYTLASGTDLAALEQEILTAMTEQTMVTVPLQEGAAGKGVLALSGATLAYAVVCPPRPAG